MNTDGISGVHWTETQTPMKISASTLLNHIPAVDVSDPRRTFKDSLFHGRTLRKSR